MNTWRWRARWWVRDRICEAILACYATWLLALVALAVAGVLATCHVLGEGVGCLLEGVR